MKAEGEEKDKSFEREISVIGWQSSPAGAEGLERRCTVLKVSRVRHIPFSFSA